MTPLASPTTFPSANGAVPSRAVLPGSTKIHTVTMPDVIAPTGTIVSVSRSKTSRVAGFDATDVVWSSDEDFTEYQLRVVSASTDSVTAGTLIEQNQSPAAGGTAGTQYTSTILESELELASGADGAKLVKLFIKDAAGNWSA